MPSAVRRIRRVRVGKNGVLTRSITPHTLAVADKYVFVMGRNATDNFIVRLPLKAVRQLLGIPREHQIDASVLDIDPDTTEYTYGGQYPKFLQDEGDDGEPGSEERFDPSEA